MWYFECSTVSTALHYMMKKKYNKHALRKKQGGSVVTDGVALADVQSKRWAIRKLP